MAELRLSLLACTALALSACQPKSAGPDALADQSREADAIRGVESDRADQMNERDLDHAAAYFAPTAIVAWPGGRPTKGTAQIRAALAESFKDPAFHVAWSPDHIKVSKEGDLAWAMGGYTLTHTDPATNKPVTVQGPFVETFAKDADDRWLITSGVSGAVSSAAPE